MCDICSREDISVSVSVKASVSVSATVSYSVSAELVTFTYNKYNNKYNNKKLLVITIYLFIILNGTTFLTFFVFFKPASADLKTDANWFIASVGLMPGGSFFADFDDFITVCDTDDSSLIVFDMTFFVEV